jgi:hypothetical protein
VKKINTLLGDRSARRPPQLVFDVEGNAFV